jgi:predicted acyltransferase
MASSPTVAQQRLVAIDAYRGLVMFLMMAELLRLPRLARAFPDSPIWEIIGFNTSHVEWTGCSLHDLIQPSFSFLVGVALPYSVASRVARGQPFALMLFHAVWRSLLLIALGIFLRSVGREQTNFTFEDTLTQIGLGYTFLFLLAFCREWVQWAVLAFILAGYWTAFALYPLPGPDFSYPAVGVPANWPHLFSGFEAHWNKNSNPAWAFDVWFLNLFPRPRPFIANGGGYATLSFIPTLGTMLLGLIAGRWLREDRSKGAKLLRLLVAGAFCMAAGWLLDWAGICPSVKRIWTPAWTLYSGGWCFFILAGFYAINEMLVWRAWAFPLVVIGMNSIAIYCLVHLIDGFIIGSFRTHLGRNVFQLYGLLGTSGPLYEPVVAGAAALVVFWLILLWMYRRRIFLKI